MYIYTSPRYYKARSRIFFRAAVAMLAQTRASVYNVSQLKKITKTPSTSTNPIILAAFPPFISVPKDFATAVFLAFRCTLLASKSTKIGQQFPPSKFLSIFFLFFYFLTFNFLIFNRIMGTEATRENRVQDPIRNTC